MEGEYIIDDSEPATFLTLRDKRRTAMNKPVQEMALLSLIYDMDLRNLSEEHELDAKSTFRENKGTVSVRPFV